MNLDDLARRVDLLSAPLRRVERELDLGNMDEVATSRVARTFRPHG